MRRMCSGRPPACDAPSARCACSNCGASSSLSRDLLRVPAPPVRRRAMRAGGYDDTVGVADQGLPAVGQRGLQGSCWSLAFRASVDVARRIRIDRRSPSGCGAAPALALNAPCSASSWHLLGRLALRWRRCRPARRKGLGALLGQGAAAARDTGYSRWCISSMGTTSGDSGVPQTPLWRSTARLRPSHVGQDLVDDAAARSPAILRNSAATSGCCASPSLSASSVWRATASFHRERLAHQFGLERGALCAPVKRGRFTARTLFDLCASVGGSQCLRVGRAAAGAGNTPC